MIENADSRSLLPATLLAALVTAALSGAAEARQLGLPVGTPIDVRALTGSSTCNALEYAWGSYFVGAGPTQPGNPDNIYEISLSTGNVRVWPGCLPAFSTGATDFAADEANSVLMAAKGNRECVYVKNDDGSITCVYGATVAYATGALARDPVSGHYFATWGVAPLTVFTLDLNTYAMPVVNTLPPCGKEVRGLSWNEVTGTLWAFCTNGQVPGGNDLVEFHEIDPTTGQLTGLWFPGDLTLGAPNLAGGCDIFHDVRNPGMLSIIGLHRSSPDQIGTYSLGVPFGCTGYPLTYCTAKVNALGCLPSISSTGSPSASAGLGFTVQGTNVRNNKPGLLLYSVSGRQVQPLGGGVLCLAPAVRRSWGLAAGGTPPPANDCSGNYLIDMNAFAVSVGPPVPLAALRVAGTQVNCQFWGRDPGFPAPNNTTLTDALEYIVCP